jgi:competence protein ComEA
VDWLKLKIAEAIGGKQPINKNLLFLVGGVVAAAVFLINGISSGGSDQPTVNAVMPSDQPIVQPASIYVHVVGEVNSPGIYELDSGARLVDVIFAAGGFAKHADQASVNLAREVTDGEQVVVFKVGAAPQLIGSVSSGAGSGAAQISLNRATQSELEALPGVGPELAGRMIDWRTANGGFKKKEDLLNVSGIGDKLFAGIKNQVTL